MNHPLKNRFLYFILLLAVSAFLPAASKIVPRIPHPVPHISASINIDGVLDEPVWNEALVLELNYEVLPGDNIKPPVRTQVLLAYDDHRLYAGFRCFDPDPSSIRAHCSDRENLGNDDYVALVLDTFNDRRRAYQFYCNPLGIQSDFIYSPEGGGERWDSIWDSAGKINKEGYCVEMSIPFNALRFPSSEGELVWGFDAVRNHSRVVRHLIGLFPRDRNNNCYLCQAEKLVGFKGVSPGRNLEFNPTLVAKRTDNRPDFPNGDFKKLDSSIEPGLSARWSITPNMALNATINPDFSNVEADSAQLDINTRFALNYPEKRPFFLEGAPTFNTRMPAVYTRTLADPRWGAKITGKQGDSSLGFFTVQDKITNLVIPGSQGSTSALLDQFSLGSALRYRRDVGRASAIGVLATDREGDQYHNRVFGVDGDFKFTRRDRVRAQVLVSQTGYPDAVVRNYEQPDGNFWGGAVDFSYSHDSRSWNWFANFRDVSNNFRADLGFMPQAGYRNYYSGVFHDWYRRPGYWFTKIQTGASLQWETDHDGEELGKIASFWVTYNGPLQSTIGLTGNFGTESYMGRDFDTNNLQVQTGLLYKELWFGFGGYFGQQVDYVNVRQGTKINLNPTLQFQFGRHVSTVLSHIYERLNVDVGRLYTANITNFRLMLQFDRRTFLRVILQYTDTKYEMEHYIRRAGLVPHLKKLFTQILFSYKINPQTVLFVGYSDDAKGYLQIPLTRTNRTIFMKVGYALVL